MVILSQFIVLANIIYKTIFTFRVSCRAYIAPVKNQPVVRVLHEFVGNALKQGFFDFFGSIALGKACFGCNPQKVGVYRHRVFAPNHIEDHIRRLSTNSA